MHTVSLRSLTTTWAARLVAAFDASGVHRVGTPGDLASGVWFAAEAAQSGVAMARLPVPIQYTRVEEAYLACAGLRTRRFADVRSPACAGVSGTLCASEGQGDIGFAAFPSNAASIKGQPLEQLRRTTGMRALVVATRVTGDSLAPINAQYYTTPFGPPVLQVAGMHHAFLAAQVARNTPVQFVSRYRREAVDSFNIAAHAASGTSVPPIAVVTQHWLVGIDRRGGRAAWVCAKPATCEVNPMMPVEQQVCSHELAKRLAALGVQQESVFWWVDRKLTYTGGRASHAPRHSGIAAFTVAELGRCCRMKSSSPRKMARCIRIGSGLGAIAARGIVFGVPTLEGPRGPISRNARTPKPTPVRNS